MHAKMTRDRKKNFIATIEMTIEELERDNQKMRDVLKKVGGHEDILAATTPANTVTPIASPMINSANPEIRPKQVTPEAAAASSLVSQKNKCNSVAAAPKPIKHENPPKRPRVAHGFCLSS